jgi:hypothetical protein
MVNTDFVICSPPAFLAGPELYSRLRWRFSAENCRSASTTVSCNGPTPDPAGLHRSCSVLDGRDQKLLNWIGEVVWLYLQPITTQ